METHCNRAPNLERVHDVYSACFLFLENRRAERLDELLRGTNLQTHQDGSGTITLGLGGAAEAFVSGASATETAKRVGKALGASLLGLLGGLVMAFLA